MSSSIGQQHMIRLVSASAVLLPILALTPNPAFAQQAAPDSRMIEAMERADLNGDGLVSRDELIRYRATQWDRMDRNGDGYFAQDDLPGFLRDRWNSGRLADLRAGFDRNGDGRISRQEFVDGPTRAFDMADANGDGRVSQAEIRALRARAGR